MLRTVVRYRWTVVAFWASVTVASVVFLPSLASVVRNDTASFLPAERTERHGGQVGRSVPEPERRDRRARCD